MYLHDGFGDGHAQVVEDFDVRPLGPTTIREDESMEVFAVMGEIALIAEASSAKLTELVNR